MCPKTPHAVIGSNFAKPQPIFKISSLLKKCEICYRVIIFLTTSTQYVAALYIPHEIKILKISEKRK